jgi:hypothetical protein
MTTAPPGVVTVPPRDGTLVAGRAAAPGCASPADPDVSGGDAALPVGVVMGLADACRVGVDDESWMEVAG